MSFEVKIVEDSVSKSGDRLTSFQLRYPRYILAELNTHRVFSRSSASSRAIPTKTMIKRIIDDTARPVSWGKNQKGMQAGEELNDPVLIPQFTEIDGEWIFNKKPFTREEAWDYARDWAITVATAFDAAGYHKQVVNRLLEPFVHVSTIVTATEFSNWFELRSHKDADPTIRYMSDMMLEMYRANTPKVLAFGEWHMPYVTKEERNQPVETLLKLSTARCARVSYNNHDGTSPDVMKDLALYEDLVGSRPLHASPAEHQGTPDDKPIKCKIYDDYGTYDKRVFRNERMHGNFVGWVQNRKVLELTVLK